MATYRFRCPYCGHEQEIKRSMKDDSTVLCDECAEHMVQVIGAGEFILKEGGWYKPSHYADRIKG